MWSSKQIEQHAKACKHLDEIKNAAFDLVRTTTNISEYEVSQFILQEFTQRSLLTTHNQAPMVAFNENTAKPHYHPKMNSSRKLDDDTLVYIDLWARLKETNAPYSDITWMGYYGDAIPKPILEQFQVVQKTRDLCLKFVRRQLKKDIIPTGSDIELISDGSITYHGYGSGIKHAVGHPLGIRSPHAGSVSDIDYDNDKALELNLGYTIEPGIYTEKRGFRTEIDFYISADKRLVVTTPLQKKLVLLK